MVLPFPLSSHVTASHRESAGKGPRRFVGCAWLLQHSRLVRAAQALARWCLCLLSHRLSMFAVYWCLLTLAASVGRSSQNSLLQGPVNANKWQGWERNMEQLLPGLINRGSPKRLVEKMNLILFCFKRKSMCRFSLIYMLMTLWKSPCIHAYDPLTHWALILNSGAKIKLLRISK